MKKFTGENIRLNKYIANTGLCTRRKADEYIKAGKVKVNGKIVSELGIKVGENDEVSFQDQTISSNQKLTYLLINKPQNYASDKQSKKNIWQLINAQQSKHLFTFHPLSPISCGLSLVTNDKSLVNKLKNLVSKKLYYLQLEKTISDKELQQLKVLANKAGLKVQSVNFVLDKPMSHIGIELYDKTDVDLLNILKQLNLKVIKLDRVMFDGLTKKDLPRSRWRHLTQKEIITLKHF